MDPFEKIIENMKERKSHYEKLYARYGDGEDYRMAIEINKLIESTEKVANEYRKKNQPLIDALDNGVEGFYLQLKAQYRKGYEDAKKDFKWTPCTEPPKTNECVVLKMKSDRGITYMVIAIWTGECWKHSISNKKIDPDKAVEWQPLPV